MKKLIALLLACILLLSLSSAAFAEPGDMSFEAEEAYLNLASNTIAVLLPDEDYYQLMSAEGEILVPASEKYTEMHPMWDMPYFTVEQEGEDPLQCKGILAGDGTVLVPARYFMTDWLSDDWQVGILAVPCGEEEADYEITVYWPEKAETYYSIDTADFYYKGDYAGSLDHDSYTPYYHYAYGAYLGIANRAGDHVFYNSKLERSPHDATFFEEFDSDYDYETDQLIYYHQGSGQQAFVPECTLDPADLAVPYLYLDGALYDIRGQEIARYPSSYDFDYFRDFVDGYSISELDGKTGVITLKGEELVPFEYDRIGIYEEHPFRYGYISAVKDGMLGFLDADGKPTGDFIYPEDDVYNYGTFAVIREENDAITVISAAVGALPETYSYVDFPGSEGCVAFIAEKEDGTMGVVDLYGNTLVPFGEYYDIKVSLDGTTALISVDYEHFIVCRF